MKLQLPSKLSALSAGITTTSEYWYKASCLKNKHCEVERMIQHISLAIVYSNTVVIKSAGWTLAEKCLFLRHSINQNNPLEIGLVWFGFMAYQPL